MQAEVVRLILSRLAPDAGRQEASTPSSAACPEGRRAASSPASRASVLADALVRAAERGHEDVVRALLEGPLHTMADCRCGCGGGK